MGHLFEDTLRYLTLPSIELIRYKSRRVDKWKVDQYIRLTAMSPSICVVRCSFSGAIARKERKVGCAVE